MCVCACVCVRARACMCVCAFVCIHVQFVDDAAVTHSGDEIAVTEFASTASDFGLNVNISDGCGTNDI